MGRIISRRLANSDTDPLPIGPTVFTYRMSKEPTSKATETPVQQSPGKDKSSNPALANQPPTPEEEEARRRNLPEKGWQAATQQKRRGE